MKHEYTDLKQIQICCDTPEPSYVLNPTRYDNRSTSLRFFVWGNDGEYIFANASSFQAIRVVRRYCSPIYIPIHQRRSKPNYGDRQGG